jgi:hypothetical protein
MEVLRVIRLVLSFKPSGELSKEELEDIAEFVLCIRRFWSIKSQDISETTGSIRLYASVLM